MIILAEANKAFELNAGLFASLKAPTPAPSTTAKHPAAPDYRAPQLAHKLEPFVPPELELQPIRTVDPMRRDVLAILAVLALAYLALQLRVADARGVTWRL